LRGKTILLDLGKGEETTIEGRKLTERKGRRRRRREDMEWA
jgi:hypothetical protein